MLKTHTGFRAKFITGSVQVLLGKEGGGEEWLKNLRNVDYLAASQALISLPGIGPKVWSSPKKYTFQHFLSYFPYNLQ